MKQTIIKYIFAFSIVCPIVLNYLKVISTFYEFLIMGIATAIAAILIIFKKYYFLSNLIGTNNETYSKFEITLGKFTGFACLVISIVFFIIAFRNK